LSEGRREGFTAADLKSTDESQDVLGRVAAMRCRRVNEILLPFEEGLPLDPCVEMGERIIDAIQLMVSNNLKRIAVMRNQRPVGMIRLDDAFQKVGLPLRNQ